MCVLYGWTQRGGRVDPAVGCAEPAHNTGTSVGCAEPAHIPQAGGTTECVMSGCGQSDCCDQCDCAMGGDLRIDQLHLFFGDTELEDDRRLEDYNITNESKLRLAIREHGGGGGGQFDGPTQYGNNHRSNDA